PSNWMPPCHTPAFPRAACIIALTRLPKANFVEQETYHGRGRSIIARQLGKFLRHHRYRCCYIDRSPIRRNYPGSPDEPWECGGKPRFRYPDHRSLLHRPLYCSCSECTMAVTCGCCTRARSVWVGGPRVCSRGFTNSATTDNLYTGAGGLD